MDKSLLLFYVNSKNMYTFSNLSGMTTNSINLVGHVEKETAAHSSILAWRIPGIEEPGGLPSMGCRIGHDRSDLAAAAAAGHD